MNTKTLTATDGGFPRPQLDVKEFAQLREILLVVRHSKEGVGVIRVRWKRGLIKSE
jgi:hypothetical protein